jgi:hypothetical protein
VASTAAVIAAAAKARHRLVVDTVPKTQTQQEATDKLIQECRKSWTDDEMRMLITHLDRALLRRWTQFNRAGIAIGVAVAMLLSVGCGIGGMWWGSRIEAAKYVRPSFGATRRQALTRADAAHGLV